MSHVNFFQSINLPILFPFHFIDLSKCSLSQFPNNLKAIKLFIPLHLYWDEISISIINNWQIYKYIELWDYSKNQLN